MNAESRKNMQQTANTVQCESHIIQTHATHARPCVRKKYASKIKSAQETQETQEITQAKNENTQAQVTQLTQAVLA